MSSLALSPNAFASPLRRSPVRRQLQTVRHSAAPVRPAPSLHQAAPDAARPRLGGWWLAIFAVAAHAGLAWYALHAPAAAPAKPEPRLLKLNFTKPEPAKPPEPPPPEIKPQPVLRKPLPAAPKPVPTTPVALPQTATAPSSEPAVAVASGPVAEPVAQPAPAAVSAPPAPPAPEPLVPARGGIGYLNNPAPEYPRQAQTQGWEGRVLLLVRVGVDGRALQVDVKTSSGRRILDEAAQRTVKEWHFAAAHRGETAVEGWATVPIEFRL